MLSPSEQMVSRFLQGLSEELDIPPSKYKQAVERYQALANWLSRSSSPLLQYRPEIYPQGSFRLGTIVRPVRDGLEADYDLDLVCQLQRAKATGQERDAKHSVGDRLKANENYAKILDKEGKHCWTLNYTEEDGVGFHMDCLPCIPEDEGSRRNLMLGNVPWEYAQHAVCITDREDNGTYHWLGSNPRGYAKWFEEVNRPVFNKVASEQKKALFERAKDVYAAVEQVPDALIRTPLQRTIQILKRHRDWRFIGHSLEKEKPISMIITTLAVLSYGGESDIYSALVAMIQRVKNYGETGILHKVNGRWYIGNPVNRQENFADRWNESDSKFPDAFFKWVEWVQEDLTRAVQTGTPKDLVNALAEGFDRQQLEKVAERVQPGSVIMKATEDSVPGLADYRHRLPLAWLFNLRYKVRVTGTVHKAIGQPKVLWQLTNRPLPKDLGLRFKAETKVPMPYEIKWQVVNTGADAVAADGLRGEFYDGSGSCGTTRWERTLYRGTHWIEAFVIKDNVCVARSSPTYVRIK